MVREFHVGMVLDINEECLGVITTVANDRVLIDSECFRGWATKEEIASAMEEWATEEQCLCRPPQLPASAA